MSQGIVLPGNNVTFDFNFLSENAGAYNEEWELTTQPELSAGAQVVSIKGISLAHVENSLQTQNLEAKLAASMQMSTVAAMLGDLIPEIDMSKINAVEQVLNPTPPSAPAPPLTVGRSADVTEELFNAQNRPLHLFYSPDTFPSWAALAAKTFSLVNIPAADREWDLSVESLYQWICRVVDQTDRQRCLDTLAVLVRIAATPPSESTLRYAIAHTLLGDWATDSRSTAETKKAELIAAGSLPADEGPGEDEEGKPTPAPRSTGRTGAWPAEDKEAMEAQIGEMLGETIDHFEMLCEAGEAESRLMALQHFGLLPREEAAEEEDDELDEFGNPVVHDKDGNVVPPIGTSQQLEQISMSMSSLNASANMTGSQLYSSLVDGGGHSERILRELSRG